MIEDFRPDDASGAHLGKLNRHAELLSSVVQQPADDIIDIEDPAGILWRDPLLAQSEDGALRDDEKAAQLGKLRDHIMREAISRPSRDARASGLAGEGHHRDGCPARLDQHAFSAGAARGLYRHGRGCTGLREAVSLGPGGAPRLAKGPVIEPLGLEQTGARRELLLALANAAAPRKRCQQRLMRALVERRELQPFLQILEDRIARAAADELLE